MHRNILQFTPHVHHSVFIPPQLLSSHLFSNIHLFSHNFTVSAVSLQLNVTFFRNKLIALSRRNSFDTLFYPSLF